jgi:hypothetical protein
VALSVALCAVIGGTAAAEARAAAQPWEPVPAPWTGPGSIRDLQAFGVAGLAAAGDGGRIGISRDGGHSWTVVVPPGHDATVFNAIAASASGQGVVASGGLLLVTSDGGTTWQPASYVGPGPEAAINDVALRGSHAVAVGDGGVIMESDDGGATWTKAESPVTSSITCVALTGDGIAIAGSVAGDILVSAAGAWQVAAVAANPVTSVAAVTAPIWNDGRPDLLAATGTGFLGSDDALQFRGVPGFPGPVPHPWPLAAWVGVPDSMLLLSGAGEAGFLTPATGIWTPGATGLSLATRAAAPGGQSVAYLLGSDGRILRTLSAGRSPAEAGLSRAQVVTGGRTRLTATVRVGAPGTLTLRRRVPGRAWQTARAISWQASDWGRRIRLDATPALTQQFKLEFRYAGATTEISPVVQVDVRPRITTARSRITLRVGDVYHFAGSVSPALTGERVGLFTDRGGSWRPVSLQASVSLRRGRTWSSRSFGTPAAETYHLRAHLSRTQSHAEAWSRVVTVSISR